MSKRVNCMFLLPPELTGLDYDACRIFGTCPEAAGAIDRCVGRTKHTPVSRKALDEAIEIRRAEREKNSSLTPSTVL